MIEMCFPAAGGIGSRPACDFFPVFSLPAGNFPATLDPPRAPLIGNRASSGVGFPGRRMGVLLRPEDASEAAIRDWCVDYLARTLELPEEQIQPDATFARLGLDSANSVYLIVELEEWLGLELTPELIFDHPTIADLARYLAGRAAGEQSIG
jgi:acyl carrier protein